MDNPPSRKPPSQEEEQADSRIRSSRSDDGLLRECRVDTFRSGGAGGQHQNKVESGVRLTHHPSGIVVASRRHRSQHRNREDALRRLREELARRRIKTKRRIRTRVPRGERQKRLNQKKKRSRLKLTRKKPGAEDE